MAGIGHNNGPDRARDQTYRAHQWRSAQRKLMRKTIPLMIVRMRMQRAAELGFDYKTYASIRQTSGQDIMALLFSSNALRIIGNGARMPAAENRILAQLKAAQKLSLVHLPNTAQGVAQANPVLDATDAAPRFTDSWSQMRDRLQGFIHSRRLPGNQVLVIGDTSLEAQWTPAARAGGYLSAARYFPHQSG